MCQVHQWYKNRSEIQNSEITVTSTVFYKQDELFMKNQWLYFIRSFIKHLRCFVWAGKLRESLPLFSIPLLLPWFKLLALPVAGDPQQPPNWPFYFQIFPPPIHLLVNYLLTLLGISHICEFTSSFHKYHLNWSSLPPNEAWRGQKWLSLY